MTDLKKINSFTSTGLKLLHHEDAVRKIKDNNIATPLCLQVSPTGRCNLSCSFCANANRKITADISIDAVCQLIDAMAELGLRSVEITGGGEPTLYTHFETLASHVVNRGLKLGMITNGTRLYKIDPFVLNKFDWIRISMNTLDMVEQIEIPEIRGVMGFSYVWNDQTTLKDFEKVQAYVDRYRPKYVRVLPDCQTTPDIQKKNNVWLSRLVGLIGPPYFFHEKEFKQVRSCYWCYFKPFLYYDGYVYPCNSVVHNTAADRAFTPDYRWCHMSDLLDKYREPMERWPAEKGTNCVFNQQNELIFSLMDKNPMVDFV